MNDRSEKHYHKKHKTSKFSHEIDKKKCKNAITEILNQKQFAEGLIKFKNSKNLSFSDI